MNSKAETKTDSEILQEFERMGYGYIQRLVERWKGRVYFTDAGKARLGCILGYILGLKHAGLEIEAQRLAEDFETRMKQLTTNNNDFVVERTIKTSVGDDGKSVETKVETKVPNRKVILHDDGTWHGFSIMWYALLNPEVYEEKLKAMQEEISKEREAGNDVWDTAHQRVVKALRIIERVDPNAPYSDELTEYRFLEKGQTKFYYIPSYNGGFIYHGPGAGETFTVNLGSGTLWGIHT